MPPNIHEPSRDRAISATRYQSKDTRQRPFVSRSIQPVNNGDPIPATSPAWTPELQNSFEQSTSPLAKWVFRMRYDGDIQFLGVLDASNGAANHTIAMTLPGVSGGQPNYVPPDDQSYDTFVTVDGTTVIPAAAFVEAATGDVTISWGNTGLAIYEIKVFEDNNQVVVGDDKFVWEIPEDLDNAELIKVEAFITTAGTGTTQIQLRHSDPCDVGTDILSTKITIDSGECNSKDAAVQPVISGGIVTVAWGDHLHIDVDAAASGAKGLGLMVTLIGSPLGSVTIQGSQGPPGGVTNWTGQWQDATPYQTGDAVSNGGTTYVSITNHISNAANDEPGVGTNWEDFWMPLVEGHEPVSGVSVAVLGNGYPVDVGIKAAFPVPFDCEIIEATLLADVAGNCVVDLWVDTYGNYPPTDADSITGGTPLTLSGANKTTDTALTGWTTTLTAGDIIAFVVESASTVGWITGSLRVQRP